MSAQSRTCACWGPGTPGGALQPGKGSCGPFHPQDLPLRAGVQCGLTHPPSSALLQETFQFIRCLFIRTLQPRSGRRGRAPRAVLYTGRRGSEETRPHNINSAQGPLDRRGRLPGRTRSCLGGENIPSRDHGWNEGPKMGELGCWGLRSLGWGRSVEPWRGAGGPLRRAASPPSQPLVRGVLGHPGRLRGVPRSLQPAVSVPSAASRWQHRASGAHHQIRPHAPCSVPASSSAPGAPHVGGKRCLDGWQVMRGGGTPIELMASVKSCWSLLRTEPETKKMLNKREPFSRTVSSQTPQAPDKSAWALALWSSFHPGPPPSLQNSLRFLWLRGRKSTQPLPFCLLPDY